jgi:hypothetical protein
MKYKQELILIALLPVSALLGATIGGYLALIVAVQEVVHTSQAIKNDSVASQSVSEHNNLAGGIDFSQPVMAGGELQWGMGNLQVTERVQVLQPAIVDFHLQWGGDYIQVTECGCILQ